MKINCTGQALISLLVFMIIVISVTTGAILLLISNSINTTKIARANTSLVIAEAGVENALLRLLRDPAYTGEEFSFPEGETQVLVTGSNPYLIVSSGESYGFLKTIEVSVQFVDNKMSILSWKEVF